jgi:hypothetical protein
LQRKRQTQRTRFWGALAFVGLGLGIIWFTKAIIGVTGDGLFVAELFVAILVFLILTGQISELTAGGVTAKFRELADDRIDPEPAPMIVAEETYIVEKSGMDALDRLRDQLRVQDLEQRGPVVLSLKLGSAGRLSKYGHGALLEYGHALASFERFHFVMFIRQDQRLVGYIPYARFERVLNDQATGWQFIEAVNTGDEQTVRSSPGVITSTLTIGMSNADALDRMAQLNMEAMIVVDAESRPVGIIEREKLASQMLVAMTRL